MSLNSFDMAAFFAGITDMVDYLHTIDLLNAIISAVFVVGAVVLAIGYYWLITSGSED